LYGLYRPDEGEIRLRGRAVHFRSPHDAIAHGLGMIHQHFMLVPTFTVAENLMLGQPSPRHPLLADRRVVARRIVELSAQYGLQVDPHVPVWQLSVGQEQRVEILKALYRGAEILILDEPTAVLTPQEVDELLAILRTLAADGRSIIFISHKLREVMEVCDRIAVMRDGRLVDVVLTAQTTAQALSRMMVGREVMLRVEKAPATPGEVLLRIENLHAKDDRGLPALRGVNLTVRAGEIVGVAGVEGNGQRELEEALRGLRAVSAGRIELCGRDVTGRMPRDIIEAGLGHVPSDRYRMGLLRDFSVAENLALVTVDRPPFTRRGLLDMSALRSHARRLAQTFDVRTSSVDARVATLSGGNAQKVVLAREIAHGPRVLLVAQPTRGVDVGAIEYVHRELVRRRDEGMAILLISTELDEILALSDRIVVLYQGRIVGERPAAGVSVEALGLMMGGTPPHLL
ncbi:MAG: ABC transporter ATP-binding protein, partial [Caldilinea sp.]|nr:ABC transporter ATP-binding protein [Caldilinea sp.]MDW8442408.1 ABC transporter ATP-binding protein [Caldilineaceae bacterium]